MIPRYSRPDMVAIWSPETKFRIWFEIEAHACDALAKLGVIPESAARTIWEKGGQAEFDVARIDEIERETKHDVIAFLTHLAEIVGPDARFVHQGMTSSDVLDTCFNVQLVRAADILLADMDDLLAALKRRAFEHSRSPRAVGPSWWVGLPSPSRPSIAQTSWPPCEGTVMTRPDWRFSQPGASLPPEPETMMPPRVSVTLRFSEVSPLSSC